MGGSRQRDEYLFLLLLLPLFAVMLANHVPKWLASFTDEFVLDILDKVCVAYLSFFIYRQLPKRIVHFFSGDK